MEKIVEFLSQPIIIELVKAIFYGCVGAALAILFHDMRVERMEKKEQMRGKHEKI